MQKAPKQAKTPKEDKQPKLSKEFLFEDFYGAVRETFPAMESHYGVKGMCHSMFGGHEPSSSEAKEYFHSNSPAWGTLEDLYEYAINGQDDTSDTQYLVIASSDILKIATSEFGLLSKEWEDIVAMGDGRYALDEGEPVMAYKVALLANVDIRTVRNAISSGALETVGGDADLQFVDNQSARRWLLGRRGFKPTISQQHIGVSLETISKPKSFGDFVKSRVDEILSTEVGRGRKVEHPEVNEQRLAELENGVFSLPLDAAFPIADYLNLDRKTFLACVMRVFFSVELAALQGA